MGEEDREQSKFSPLVMSIIIIAAAVVVFAIVFGAINKSDDNDIDINDPSLTGTHIKTAVNIPNGEAVDAPDSDDVPQAISTTNASDRKDGSSLSEGTASELIKGLEATNRWSATSVISSVTAERVKVKLDVYEDGEKTGETKSRYMYVAVVETRPSRITFLNAGQYASKRISGIPAIIKGYEKTVGEDILFACSNEVCTRDDTNPNGNIYFDSKNNLEGTVIKDGVLAQQGKSSLSLTINKNGKWEFPVRVSLSSSEEIIKFGALNSVSYTYPVLWNGKDYDHSESEISYDIWSDFVITPGSKVSSDRTLIGQIDENKYAFLISEGFSGGYLIDYMKSLGAKNAYWGSGGYATGMYIEGYGVITSNNYVAHGDLFCIK